MIIQKLTVSEEKDVQIGCPTDILKLSITEYLENQEQENFVIIALNAKKSVTSVRVISVGTVNYTVVHAREVFRYAIMENASAVIICHNHPSGDCSPSEDDLKTTDDLIKAGEVLGIKVLDHIIISKDKYFSFLENDWHAICR